MKNPQKATMELREVDATPVKAFFVQMLTRDISLHDAILDLLDNCVDGLLRKKGTLAQTKPYKGFSADICFDRDSFSIADNCGGIPWKLHDYAFRMGRSSPEQSDDLPTLGAYGIGMKRAIFKLGQQCLIWTQHGKDNYEVAITPEWLSDDASWKIPVSTSEQSMAADGTSIRVTHLHKGISALFGAGKEAFQQELTDRVATNYAFIIDKGFEVRINGQKVKPKPTQLLFADPIGKSKQDAAIRPFIYKTEVDGVKVFLAVGFTRPIPSVDDVQDEQREARYSTVDAGWTVLCNDRAVLYCDRSEMTGWGEAGVPNYHTQFIAISGIVEFQSNDPTKLPTTTTKRGIDASSPLYLQIKNKMREGMSIFIEYTNKWKGQADESKAHIERAQAYPLEQVKLRAEAIAKSPARAPFPGLQFKPVLPLPQQGESLNRRVSFVKPAAEIKAVARYLFDDEDVAPSQVGEKCFDEISREAD